MTIQSFTWLRIVNYERILKYVKTIINYFIGKHCRHGDVTIDCPGPWWQRGTTHIHATLRHVSPYCSCVPVWQTILAMGMVAALSLLLSFWSLGPLLSSQSNRIVIRLFPKPPSQAPYHSSGEVGGVITQMLAWGANYTAPGGRLIYPSPPTNPNPGDSYL